MSRSGSGNFPLLALRPLALLLLFALFAGCGQKGDLYRPGKTQKLAAHADIAHRA